MEFALIHANAAKITLEDIFKLDRIHLDSTFLYRYQKCNSPVLSKPLSVDANGADMIHR